MIKYICCELKYVNTEEAGFVFEDKFWITERVWK